MKIKLRNDLLEILDDRISDKKLRRLEKAVGKWITVDTEYLFKDEYNTKIGRIPDYWVDQIKDDVRIGKARCDLCGETSDSIEVCTKCGKSDYLDEF